MGTTPIFDLGTAISNATAQITTMIQANLPAELTLAGGLIALTLAWKYGKKFLKG